MSSKLRRRCLLLFASVILGLSISLYSNFYKAEPVLATASASVTSEATNAAELEAQGKYFYSIAQFKRAVDLWQQAIDSYDDGDILSQARVLSNLALAHSQLNNWSRATASIATSLDLLEHDARLDNSDRASALAQVLNNQGITLLNQGKAEQAISAWKQAEANYQQVGDKLGVIRASINQASAFKQLGLYRRALKSLSEVEQRLAQLPDSSIKVTGLRSYGDILRLVGQNEHSQAVLKQSLAIASRLELPLEQIEILLILGNTYNRVLPPRALELFDLGSKICQQQPSCLQTDLPLQIYLAKFNTLLASSNLQQAIALIPAIETEFDRLLPNRVNLDRKINFAYSLIQISDRPEVKSTSLDIPNRAKIKKFLIDIEGQAKAINYQKAQSYSLGLQGHIQEKLSNWQEAQKYTDRALLLVQDLNAPEISYLWQWQLGRITQVSDSSRAIAHYSQAVELLESLTRDLVAIDPDVQYSFRDSVEPVYRELVSLLLEAEPSQANLEGARKVIESMQLAELNNFFREACLDTRVVEIDNLDRHAAVIYPIILSDRLEVILSRPDRPLKHYTTKIPQEQLEAIIEQFRQSIVVRSRRKFYPPGKKLYDLIVRPALDDLIKSDIETIVFVPDGALRNIPLSALYDGKHYLIEDYSVALTPGLQLLNPRPLKQETLKTVAAGLTKGIKGFSPLDYVNYELNQIKNMVNSVILLNRNFTTEALYREVKTSDYPVVHIATHGQFSSSLEDTFLLAWDDRINIDELNNILQTRNSGSENAIELLVLSACETATGDSRAALGLAGIAVRAGAKSTLATLWSVNDRATAELMSEFYHELSDEHLPKAEAVRQAQLSLLNNPWYKHPFYWAPYVLLGNWL